MKIIISNTSQEPIYAQIAEQIKELIIKEELRETEPLPSIRKLAKELQISVITTKRAYEELEKEGYIHTVPGKGTYISTKNKELLKERERILVEEKLIDMVTSAKTVGLSLEDLQKMLKFYYREV